MIKRILLAVDLGLHTAHLLKYAASLSYQYRASLAVVHAIEPLGTMSFNLLQTYLHPNQQHSLHAGSISSLAEQFRSQIIDVLTDEYMAGEIRLPRIEGVYVRPGDVFSTIIDVADEYDADMIILGSSPRAPIDEGISTVSQKIVANAQVPVYVIPCHDQLLGRNSVAENHIRPH